MANRFLIYMCTRFTGLMQFSQLVKRETTITIRNFNALMRKTNVVWDSKKKEEKTKDRAQASRIDLGVINLFLSFFFCFCFKLDLNKIINLLVVFFCYCWVHTHTHTQKQNEWNANIKFNLNSFGYIFFVANLHHLCER